MPTAQSTSDTSELLTTEQVMERLLAEPRLRRAATTCVLPAVKVDSEWRFRRADLEDWIERQRSAGQSQAAH